MKSLVLILFLFCSFNLNAQKWCAPGAEWYYSSVFEGGEGNCSITYEKDTIIDQQFCQKLSQLETFDLGNFYNYQSKNIYTYTNKDTVFVFLYDHFVPLYFFNSNVGDTLEFGEHYLACYKLRKVVTSKGIMIINNDTLRYYDVLSIGCSNSISLYPIQLKIVERLGSLYSLLLPLYTSISDPVIYGLTCYRDDIIGNYSLYPNEDCSILKSSVIIEQLQFEVFPNPTNESISISGINNNNIESIEITDTKGSNLLIINKVLANQEFIDLSGLNTGFYFIKVKSIDGKQGIKKFIKQ